MAESVKSVAENISIKNARIMQNKPNLLDNQMNVTFYLTKYYEKERPCRHS